MSYQQLRDAQPGKFATAADDWLKLAKEAQAAAEHVYERGGKKLESDWADDVGEEARAYCQKIAQDFQVAGMTLRGVVTTLDGLADALEMAKRNLEAAVDFATRHGLKVDGNGKVTVPEGMTDPQAADRAKQAGWLIWDAVNDATKIDNEAAASLRRLIQPAAITRLYNDQDELATTILNGSVKNAGHASLNMIKQTMPLNADPQTQAAWWNSLTPAQRNEYMRAAPVNLYDMKGIPADVKQQLMGNDGLNRIEMIRWAEKYGNTKYTDVPGMNNCANFVSYALHEGGGLPEDKSPFLGQGQPYDEDDQWYANHGLSGPPWLESLNKYSHSAPWANAESQHDYLLRHGGETVSTADARPGDLIYFKNQEGIHHSAIVTAVTPDGEVLYTQHNSDRTNVGLNDRMPHTDIRTGMTDTPIVVRPHPDWD